MTEKTARTKRNRIRPETIVIPVLAAGIIFGILIAAGTLQSGMHFADDHEIYTFTNYSIIVKQD